VGGYRASLLLLGSHTLIILFNLISNIPVITGALSLTPSTALSTYFLVAASSSILGSVNFPITVKNFSF
jgi:hypothetical protein